MKKQNLYIILMLAMLLNQSSIAKANSGDPMNVNIDSNATVTVEKQEEVKVDETKTEKKEEAVVEEAKEEEKQEETKAE